jgi:integrase/recombinase XerD
VPDVRAKGREVTSGPAEPPAAPLALVGAALDAPDRVLGPQSALTTVDGRLARVGAYESYLAGRDSAQSIVTMRESLARIGRLLGREPEAIPWHRMTFAETDAIRAALIRAEYAPDTVRVTLCALRGVLWQAAKLGLMDPGVCALAVKLPRVHGSRLPAGRDLPEEEIAKIVNYCHALGPAKKEWPTSAYGAFLSALFGVLLGAGLRATETCRLTIEGFDGAGPSPSLRLLRKGKKERQIGIGPDVVEPIEAWLAVRAELDVKAPSLFVRVFPDGSLSPRAPVMNSRSLEYLCEIVAEGAGVKPFTPHDCRRTFATRSLNAGVDLARVQRLMSHESPKTTARYDRRAWEQDAAARAAIVLWPKPSV